MRFFNPVAPLLYVDNGRAFVKVANDGPSDFEGQCSVSLIGFDGTCIRSTVVDVHVGSMEVGEVVDFSLSDLDISSCYLCASVSDVEETLLLCRPKDAFIMDPGLKFSVCECASECEAGSSDIRRRFSVEISTDRPAFYVVPDAGNINEVFSDCLFSLNGRRTVVFNSKEDVTVEEFASGLKVYDLYGSCRYPEV